MSEKKEVKAPKIEVAKVKPTKKDPLLAIKRDANGNKIMKVARGTERARRRAGLSRNWRTTKGARQMQLSKDQQIAKIKADQEALNAQSSVR